MTNKLTVVDKIDKIFEYCEYTKQLATIAGNEVRYLVEIENTDGLLETEQQCVDNSTLPRAIHQAVVDARWHSQNYNCLSSVKVYIETYNSEGKLIDEDPIDEYEINFEKGKDVQ